jgi:hypothetical protein
MDSFVTQGNLHLQLSREKETTLQLCPPTEMSIKQISDDIIVPLFIIAGLYQTYNYEEVR